MILANLISIYIFICLVYALTTWTKYRISIISKIVEPYLNIFRGITINDIDLSYLMAVLFLFILRYLVIQI